MDAQLSQQLISSLNPNYTDDISNSELTFEKPAEDITELGGISEVSEVPEWLRDNEITESFENPSNIINQEKIISVVNEGNLVEILKEPLGEKEGLQPPLPGADSTTTISNVKEDGFITQVISAHEPN